ncbi:MAG TPA: DMT family transporter [Dongiaceae bacterium]|nr:DMT family transporter [Dongiaceae bacterium]
MIAGKPPGKPLALIALLGSMWGLHFSLIRIIGESGMALGWIVAATSIGNTLILCLVAAVRRKMPGLAPGALFYYLACASIGYLAPFLLELYSAPRIGAGILTIVVCLTPLATAILAMLLRADIVTGRKLVAITLGFMSLVPLLTATLGDGFGSFSLGLLAALGVPVAYGIYHNLVAKYWPTGQDSWQVAGGEAIAFCLIMIPVYLASDGAAVPRLDWTGAEWAILLMILFSAVEIYLYFEIVRLAGAIFVSQASFITVPTGVLWGMVLFGERHDSWILFSILLLALSLILAATPAKDEKHAIESAIRPGAKPGS